MRALVVGASGGIGAALVDAYGARGWQAVGLSRREHGLDITSEDSVVSALSGLEGVFDHVIDATGALEFDGVGPERSFKRLDPEAMLQAFRVNALGPALLVKHLAERLPRDRRAVFVSLSARLASVGDNHLGGWVSYRASKSALNQILRCAAIEWRRKRAESIVVAMHPGTIDTDMTRAYAKGRYTHTPAECAANLLGVIDGLTTEDSGGFFAYDGSVIPW